MSAHADVAGYWSHLGLQIHQLAKQDYLTDFTLVAGDVTLRCHKIILAAASSYLQAVFNSGMTEAIASMLELKEMSGATLKHVVEFIYSGDTSMEPDSIEDLVKAAHFLQLTQLTDQCVSFMMGLVDGSNCIGMHAFAKTYMLSAMQQEAWDFMLEKFREVRRGQEFKDLPVADLIEYVKDDGLVVTSQDDVLEAVTWWMNEDKEARQEEMADILSKLHLERCTLSFMIKQFTESYMTSVKCREIFQEAMNSCSLDGKRMGLGVIGGLYCSNDYNTRYSDLDMTTHSWTSFSDISTVGKWFSVCQVNDGCVLTGAYPDSCECFRYSFESNLWTILPSLRVGRCLHASVSVNNVVYVVGGETGENIDTSLSFVECLENEMCDDFADETDENIDTILSSVECLDLSHDTWQTLPPLPEPCYLLQLAVYDDVVYKFGGIGAGKSDCLKNYKLDTSGTWLRLCDMPEPCRCGAASVVDDNIFLVGGYTQQCMRYTPGTDTWVKLAKPNLSHSHGSALVWMGKILLAGGYGGGNHANGDNSLTDVIEVYDHTENKWSIWKYRLKQPLKFHFLVLVPH